MAKASQYRRYNERLIKRSNYAWGKVKYGQEVRKAVQESQVGTDEAGSESWIFFFRRAPPMLVGWGCVEAEIRSLCSYNRTSYDRLNCRPPGVVVFHWNQRRGESRWHTTRSARSAPQEAWAWPCHQIYRQFWWLSSRPGKICQLFLWRNNEKWYHFLKWLPNTCTGFPKEEFDHLMWRNEMVEI